MKAEDVPAELVEKAWNGVARAKAIHGPMSTHGVLRHALAAVVPEIQAQARKEAEQERDAARVEAAEYLRMASSVSQSASRIVSSRAARLTATTEEVVARPETDRK